MRQLALALAFALLAASALGLRAGEGHGGRHGQACCPRCDHVCELNVNKDKETKYCWNVIRKPICIPRIRFPWEKCDGCDNKGCSCEGKGARRGKSACDGKSDRCAGSGDCGCRPDKRAKVKYVRILVKHEYECSKCKYQWTPTDTKGKSDAHAHSPKQARAQPSTTPRVARPIVAPAARPIPLPVSTSTRQASASRKHRR